MFISTKPSDHRPSDRPDPFAIDVIADSPTPPMKPSDEPHGGWQDGEMS